MPGCEGELYFPSSPVLTVSGTLAECVVLETLVLSVLNLSAPPKLKSASFDLRDVVEDVCALLNEQAYEKHVELTCLIENQVPDRVSGDGAKGR